MQEIQDNGSKFSTVDRIMIAIIVCVLALFILNKLAPATVVNGETNIVTVKGDMSMCEFGVQYEEFVSKVNTLYTEEYNTDKLLLDPEKAVVDEYKSRGYNGNVVTYEFYEDKGEPIKVSILVNGDTGNISNFTIENLYYDDEETISKCIEFSVIAFSALTGVPFNESQQIVAEAWRSLQTVDEKTPFVFYKNTVFLMTNTEGYCVNITPAPDDAISSSHDISSMEFTETAE